LPSFIDLFFQASDICFFVNSGKCAKFGAGCKVAQFGKTRLWSYNRVPSFKLIELIKDLGDFNQQFERGDMIAAPKTFLPDCANLQPAPNCAHLPYQAHDALYQARNLL
jgi:hypothetical protein